MRRTVLLTVALALGTALPATARAATPAERVQAAIEAVPANAIYGARDTTATPLEGLKVIQTAGTNVGVYHAQAGSRFELYVGTSSDMRTWTKRARLDTDASQGTIAALPGGGFLVAYEWANLADVIPRLGVQPLSLPAPLSSLTPLQKLVVTLDRIRIRFRYYPTLDALLAGRASRQFTAPRQLSATAQGTPSIVSAQLSPDLDHSSVELGLHYRADTDANGFPDDDREGTGVLTNFRSWSSHVDDELNTALGTTTDLHTQASGAPYTKPPSGSYGDRDELRVDADHLQVVEAQYRAGDFASWRLFLRDRGTGALRALRPRTAHGSLSFGNPTATPVSTPSGPALLVTAFVFGEAAGTGEPGELVYLSPLP